MFNASCHCGHITLKASYSPESITRCNCSICHRIGALWAYYPVADVAIDANAPLINYQWGKKRITFHSCSNCGSTTHYTMTRNDGSLRTAINSRMVDAKAIDAIPVKIFDGADSWQYL
ncbi:MAG: GFA family protein [Cellvibrionales bacterium]|nr:GFA family protein [Cellvibrionales bacterium]